jgi:hypothetical protein
MPLRKAREVLQCTIFVMNVAFFVLGGTVAALGVYMLTSAEWEDVYGTGMRKYAAGVLSFGVFVLLVSLLGCWGSRKRSRPHMLLYVIILITLFCAQALAGYYLYERFWGSLPQECVAKARTFLNPVAAKLNDDQTKVDCSAFVESKLRLTAYVLWQKLYKDYLLYQSDKVKYASFKTNSRIALELQSRAKCCGFGAPVQSIGAPASRPALADQPCTPDGRKTDFLESNIHYQRCSNRTGSTGYYCQVGLNAGNKKLQFDCEKVAEYDMPIGCEPAPSQVNAAGFITSTSQCYEYGCADAVYAFLRNHVYVIGTLLILLMLAEALGVLAACLVMNPVLMTLLVVRNVLRGVHHFFNGCARFFKCASQRTCNKGQGAAEEDEEKEGLCGWVADCAWCVCCCWVCLGVCHDAKYEDEHEEDDDGEDKSCCCGLCVVSVHDEDKSAAGGEDKGGEDDQPLTKQPTKIAV